DENIVIMTKLNNKIRLRPPSGKQNRELLKQVLSLAMQEGSDDPFGVVNAKMKEWIEKEFPKLKFLEHRDYFDYVYLASDLANLPGSGYSKIRNRLNKFKKNHAYSTEAISEENMDEVNEFLKRWCLWKDCDSDVVLANEKKAIFYSMAHFFDLGLSGLLIRISGNIEALAVYEKMSPDTAVVHYEKGSPYFDGIYKAINMETAKILQKDFMFINREEDMGIPGLRQAKLSYRPHHMVEVFHLEKNDIINNVIEHDK
ncbi:MAG: DUF2156 domain-containing protein, partial [Thermoplasmatales archaeon]|nr:DUF2156 domain-containing protein [Thermoplasmatales archaeon]